MGERHSGLSRRYWPPSAHLSQHEVLQIARQVNPILHSLPLNVIIFVLIIRYFKIPALAVRCSLYGVFPIPENLDGSLRSGVGSFLIDLHLFMGQYEAKPAVAILVDWQAGEVGYSKGSSFQELTANVVL